MSGTELLTVILEGVTLILLVILLVTVAKKKSNESELRKDLRNSLSESRIEMMNSISTYIVDMGGGIRAEQRMLQNALSESLRSINDRVNSFSLQNETQLSDIRNTMERRLLSIQEDNAVRLEAMRAVVDEKLQKTLEERIGYSFRIVSERLEQVYKGLGEMQTLAAGVGDLKRVLTNVKTRGTLGEIQLETILNEFMIKEQYETQFNIKDNNKVDYAIKMPSDIEEYLYLPIDAKFPMETYNALLDAYESGDQPAVTELSRELKQRIRTFAKDISQKYIDPPKTTDFAIMFLPVEGLYAEIIRSGVMEELQREFKVCIAGPTTISALLTSLQMGFRTMAIQKHSSEVWRILGAVKTEFTKFTDILVKAQRQIESANRDIDTLVGRRMRAMEKRLSSVDSLDVSESSRILFPEEIYEDNSDDDLSEEI